MMSVTINSASLSQNYPPNTVQEGKKEIDVKKTGHFLLIYRHHHHDSIKYAHFT